MTKNDLNLTESSDFHYLLALMTALHDEPGFACLPELFSIIGHEKLLLLCKYAGGTNVKIPTIEELSQAMEALRWFYQVYVIKRKYKKSIPQDLVPLVDKIVETYKDAL